MKILKSIAFAMSIIFCCNLYAKSHNYNLTSPNGNISATIEIDNTGTIYYSVNYKGDEIILPSPVSMNLSNGFTLGKNISYNIKKERESINTCIAAPFYRKASINEQYNRLTLTIGKKYSIEFRAYNEGFAYRFSTMFKEKFYVKNEEATFTFNKDYQLYIPYTPKAKNPFQTSFESKYTVSSISKFDEKKYSMTPLAVMLDNGHKMIITESDLNSYPGMFLKKGDGNTLVGAFAPIPATVDINKSRREEIVTSYSDKLAVTDGIKNFPWRIIAIADKDTDMPVNDMVYLLGEASRLDDISWIKPGRVAWDWWNDWSLTGVNFVPGINTETYKCHIDFAAANGLEYIIIDEGWYNTRLGTMLEVIPELDLKELVEYGNSKNVGIILWCICYVLDYDMENIFKTYSEMGIKGFKTDFLNRDDMDAVKLNYRILETAAKYKMVIDMHGMYKPTGLNRTFPNLLNYEGVWGLEQMKWSDGDMVEYDVTFPYIRMMAGSVDYTQGAMRNGQKGVFHPSYSHPMSQGTRAHQVAEYIVFDSPLVMLADAPSAYIKEQETTDFISSIPSVFEDTKILSGEIGKYIVTARRNGEVWYIGGLNGHEQRSVRLDLSFIENKSAVTIFRDGTNSNKIGEDYIMEKINIPDNGKIDVDMTDGGGFAIIVGKKVKTSEKNAATILKNIASRTSIRKFTGESVDDKMIDKILKAGMSAPTAMNSQPWVFYVVKDRETMKKLSEALPYAKMAKDAAFLVIPCGNKKKFLQNRAETYWVQDVSLTGENILLAAHALGLGAVWTGVYPMEERMNPIIEIVGLAPEHIPLCLIPIGIPAENPAPKNKWKRENIIYR